MVGLLTQQWWSEHCRGLAKGSKDYKKGWQFPFWCPPSSHLMDLIVVWGGSGRSGEQGQHWSPTTFFVDLPKIEIKKKREEENRNIPSSLLLSWWGKISPSLIWPLGWIVTAYMQIFFSVDHLSPPGGKLQICSASPIDAPFLLLLLAKRATDLGEKATVSRLIYLGGCWQCFGGRGVILAPLLLPFEKKSGHYFAHR